MIRYTANFSGTYLDHKASLDTFFYLSWYLQFPPLEFKYKVNDSFLLNYFWYREFFLHKFQEKFKNSFSSGEGKNVLRTNAFAVFVLSEAVLAFPKFRNFRDTLFLVVIVIVLVVLRVVILVLENFGHLLWLAHAFKRANSVLAIGIIRANLGCILAFVHIYR